MKLGKKSRTISDHLILWIPKFIFITIAFLSVVFLVRLLVYNNLDTSPTEARVLTNRIFYSPNAISYLDDQLGRSYPGIIDLEKFTKLQVSPNGLDTKILAYTNDNGVIAAKLTLKLIDSNAGYDVFYNKENYEFWEPRILSTVTGGSGSVKSVVEQRYVLVKTGNQFQKGILMMHVIVRK